MYHRYSYASSAEFSEEHTRGSHRGTSNERTLVGISMGNEGKNPFDLEQKDRLSWAVK